MGLKESINAGSKFQRGDVALITDASRSGSVNLGSAYVLLNITTDTPCRLRLYDTLESLDNVQEIGRAFGDTNIPAPISLVADVSMSRAGAYSIDPVMYGVVENPVNSLTYYRVDTTELPNPRLLLSRYNIEDPANSTDNRVTVTVTETGMAPLSLRTGTIDGALTPKTYLLVSASIADPTVTARLRLYASSTALTDATELYRPTHIEPSEAVRLIVDVSLTGTEITRFIPKIVGANLELMGTDLAEIRNDQVRISGANEIYYILQNTSTTDTKDISVSVHVFELER